MKYYKDNQNNVYAYEDDGSQDYLIGNKISMTAGEVETYLNPAKTQEQLAAEAKAAKQALLDAITITTTSGKVFDGREKDIPLMTGAIDTSKILVDNENARFSTIVNPTAEEIAAHDVNIYAATNTLWKMHDNNSVEISLEELKEALTLSMQAIGAIKVS